MASKYQGMQLNATKFTINKEKFLLSGVSSEYNDLPKFAEETDSHLIGEELEDSLKKPKERHSLQRLNPKTNYPLQWNSKKRQAIE